MLENKSKYSNGQYKFICELLWGSVPVDRTWAEGTNLFKVEADKILKKYPAMDKSDFTLKRCKSFVKVIKTIDNKIVMYVNHTTKKLIKYENDKGELKKSIVDKNLFDIQHVMRRKSLLYGYIFVCYHNEMNFTHCLSKGSKFI